MANPTKLVRWLPQIVEATADDIARFGPNAARVRTLLEFLPTMSDEAATTASQVRRASSSIESPLSQSAIRAFNELTPSGRYDNYGTASSYVDDYLAKTRWDYDYDSPTNAVKNATKAEVLVDRISPEDYIVLTNPLSAGRAVDLLRNRPRYQGTPFLDMVRQAAERGAVRGPRDVIAVGRIARSPEDIREIALTLMADGMPAEEAMRTARML